MSKITLQGNPFNTSGQLPLKGEKVKDFILVRNDLSEVSLETYKGKKKVLNIFPSIDTGTCAASVRAFNKKAAELSNTAVLNISVDLPFAQARFCGVEGIKNAETLSAFRSHFSKDYQLEIIDGPLKGLCSRVVIVLDENDKVLYSEQVSEIVNEPNYDEALKALSK